MNGTKVCDSEICGFVLDDTVVWSHVVLHHVIPYPLSLFLKETAASLWS